MTMFPGDAVLIYYPVAHISMNTNYSTGNHAEDRFLKRQAGIV
jgi:hypothetical protein